MLFNKLIGKIISETCYTLYNSKYNCAKLISPNITNAISQLTAGELVQFKNELAKCDLKLVPTKQSYAIRKERHFI